MDNITTLKKFVIPAREKVLSDTIVLEDKIGGDMRFSVNLYYIQSLEKSKTELKVKDGYHAQINVGTQPLADTATPEPFKIGSYNRSKELYMSVCVKPINEDGTHFVEVCFYVSK